MLYDLLKYFTMLNIYKIHLIIVKEISLTVFE